MKRKKALATILSLIMTINGFAGCTNSFDKNNTENNTSISEDSSEEKQTGIIEIGDRKYFVDKDSVDYTIKDKDTIWDISRDLKMYYTDVMDYNGLTSDLIHSGDNISIPLSEFKDTEKITGIEVSEDNGDINWEEVRYFTDFALITAADFSDDKYYTYNNNSYCIDRCFDENVEGCKENNIPYGVIVYGDVKEEELTDAKEIGKSDAKEVISLIDGYEIAYPVILSIHDLFSTLGLYTNETFCIDYCTSFMGEISKAGYYPMLCTDNNTYEKILLLNESMKDYDKIVYSSYSIYEVIEGNYNMEKSSLKRVIGIDDGYAVSVYVDNTENGMDKLVAKKSRKW